MRYAILLLLAGCATAPRIAAIDFNRPPPEGWPQLEIKVAYITSAELPKYCGRIMEPGTPTACAAINFRDGICHIYLTNKDRETLEHERAHCYGYGHVQDKVNYQARALEAYKAQK